MTSHPNLPKRPHKPKRPRGRPAIRIIEQIDAPPEEIVKAVFRGSGLETGPTLEGVTLISRLSRIVYNSPYKGGEQNVGRISGA